MTILNSYLEGEVGRGDPQGIGAHRRIRMTNHQSVVTTMFEGRYSELARAGRLYVCSPGVKAQWVAPVVDDPGTAAAYAVYNPAASGVYLSVLGVFGSTSGTQAVGSEMWIATPNTEATALTANTTGVIVKSCSGSAKTFPGFYGTGVTYDAAPAWMTVGQGSVSAVTQGGFPFVDLGGMFIVRPGSVVGAHWATGTGTSPLCGIGMLVAVLDALDVE